MNTRRLTKKYKYKSRNKKTRRNRKSRKSRRSKRRGRSGKTRRRGRRIMKGGTFEIEKQNFIRDFFTGLNQNNFPVALCALHTFYTCGIELSDINEVISSEEFKTMYASTFFKEVTIGSHTNIEPQERLMFFLSYIYKKIAEGETIPCSNNVVLDFTPGTGTFLKTLKNFFGYLDTACVLTISYIIYKTTFDVIRGSTYAITGKLCDKPPSVSNGVLALYDLVTSLELLARYSPPEKSRKRRLPFSEIEDFLDIITTRGNYGNPVLYSFNTTNMCTLIKMTQRLFTYFD